MKTVLGKDAPVNSWDLMLKPENLEKLKICGVSFLGTPSEIYARVLNYLGKDPNSDNATDYTWQAANRAKEAKNGVNTAYLIPKNGRSRSLICWPFQLTPKISMKLTSSLTICWSSK